MPGTHENGIRERELLIRDKYNGDGSVDLMKDMERLASGEPLAYVIGWIPFLGLHINLESRATDNARALIPRPETEWWAEKLIAHLYDKFSTDGAAANSDAQSFRLLDLCAGSGAIGLAVLARVPNAYVSFGELNASLIPLIRENLMHNGLGEKYAEQKVDIRESDLFDAFKGEKFDIIATNPPYIPEQRALDDSVANFEPHEALFAGADGLNIIRKILQSAREHLVDGGELWMECDTENIGEAERIAQACGASETVIHQDIYGRLRLLTARFE